MKTSVLTLLLVLPVLAFSETKAVAKTAAPAAAKTAEKKSMSQIAVEKLYAALPQDKIEKAEGFFAPVVKKYMPTVESFQKDYAAATDKMAVVEKYVPQAEAALADAKAMKVPAQYEAEKASYIKLADRFVMGLKFLVMARSAAR